ncbi:MAG: hypothetical protein ABFD92_05050 [Planctomycetaceae bacterium]
MHIEFHPAAEAELNEAIDYYNQQARVWDLNLPGNRDRQPTGY